MPRAKSALERKIRHGAGLAELVVSSRIPFGENVLTEEWDLLIILDTCRVDALLSLKDDYQWLESRDIQSRVSLGGSTFEWTAQTFREEYYEAIQDITYVSGNINVDRVLSGEETPEGHIGIESVPTRWSTISKNAFDEFIPVWEFESDTEFKPHYTPYPPATQMTDNAIYTGRQTSPDRCIVHYMQPHMPYFDAARSSGRTELLDFERDPFTYLREGGDRGKVWDAYITTLESVLNQVTTLLRNYDAERAVITADHGEAFGEWFGYGHRSGSINPYIRKVPWVEVPSKDCRVRVPNIERNKGGNEAIGERLAALGYID